MPTRWTVVLALAVAAVLAVPASAAASRIVFHCAPDLCVVNPETGASQRLTTDGAANPYRFPSISRNGQKVAALRANDVMVGDYGTEPHAALDGRARHQRSRDEPGRNGRRREPQLRRDPLRLPAHRRLPPAGGFQRRRGLRGQSRGHGPPSRRRGRRLPRRRRARQLRVRERRQACTCCASSTRRRSPTRPAPCGSPHRRRSPARTGRPTAGGSWRASARRPARWSCSTPPPERPCASWPRARRRPSHPMERRSRSPARRLGLHRPDRRRHAAQARPGPLAELG